MSDYLDANNEELLRDFFAEANQQVENLESNILVIENDPTNHDAIDEIFRAAHTLKGGAATVEFTEVSTFAHSVEDVLDEIRSDRLKVDESVVDILLSSIDVIKAMLEARSNGTQYGEDTSELLQKLRAFIPDKQDKKKKPVAPAGMGPSMQPVAPAPAPAPEPVAAAPSAAPSYSITDEEYLELKQACPAGQKLWCCSVKFDQNNPMNSVGGIQVFAALKALGTVLKTIPDFDALYEDEFYPEVHYFIATTSEASKIEDVAFLDDVTLSTDAQEVKEPGNGGAATTAAPAPQAVVQTPVAPAPAAAAPVASAAPAKPVAAAPAATVASAAPAKPAAAASAPAKKPAAPAGGASHNQGGTLLRVDSKRIDYLLNLVSEEVITKAAFNQNASQFGELQVELQNLTSSYKEKIHRMFEQLPQYLEEIQNGATVKSIQGEITQEFGDVISYFDGFESAFKSVIVKFRSSTQNLGRIAAELQEGVMKIRMVPINQIFSRFPRVIRDLSRDLNKKINLVIEGEDTELDKSVVEDLLDPIMHCVRNSADHGIETPDVRAAAGKPEEGTVRLTAANEGNMINIDISDDGAGIDVEAVRNKAIKKGLIHPDKIITDQEAYQLIFQPGFSTSEKITNVSGRGVGLDVVKTMIDKLKGTVSVTSVPGKGSTFSIRLPLTLAIIQGLLVRVGKEVYSIPIVNVIESQRVKMEEINTIDNYEVLNVRNEVISILRLSRLFNIKNTSQSEYCFIVIVGSQDKKIGIMVDQLIGEEDVVIKPLRDQFTTSPGIAGASILGDGSVSLIIDVSQLLELGVRQEIDAQEAASQMNRG
ncbi:MAG: chemotaxis protein CheA [Treponema sp.]|nr:chemotaxis protein CheA [Treponema sp.]